MGNTGVIITKRPSDKFLEHVRALAKADGWDPVLDPLDLSEAFQFPVQVHCSKWKWKALCERMGSEEEALRILNDVLNEALNPDYHFRQYEEFGAERYLLYRPLKPSESEVYAVLLAYLSIKGRDKYAEIVIL